MVTLVGFAMLISPNLAGVIQFGWLPMIIAEIATGVWLLFKGLRPIKVPSNLIN
jgi:hypothetical protein